MSVTIRTWNLKKGKTLYLDINHKSQRFRESLDIVLTGDKDTDAELWRIAEIRQAKKQIELLADAGGIVVKHRGDVGLVEFCLESDSPAIKRSEKHLRGYFGPLSLSGVTAEKVVGYQSFLSAKGLKESTVETYLNTLVSQLNRAVKEKMILSSPAVGVKRIRALEKPPASLTDEELGRLLKTPIMGENGFGGEVKRAFEFSCYTGLRWSDDVALTYGKIRSMKVRGPDGTPVLRHQVEATQIKTGAPVYVPLNEKAWALVDPGDRLPAHDEKVFPLLRAGTDPNQYTHPWGMAARIPGLNFHRSRHTFPRFLLDQGVDLVTVQNLMGHKKIETTARYGKASDRQKMDAVDRLNKDFTM